MKRLTAKSATGKRAMNYVTVAKRREKIEELLKSGRTVLEVSAKTGAPYLTVYQTALRLGVIAPKKKRVGMKAKIQKLIAQGMRSADIARELNCKPQYVYMVKAGIK